MLHIISATWMCIIIINVRIQIALCSIGMTSMAMLETGALLARAGPVLRTPRSARGVGEGEAGWGSLHGRARPLRLSRRREGRGGLDGGGWGGGRGGHRCGGCGDLRGWRLRGSSHYCIGRRRRRYGRGERVGAVRWSSRLGGGIRFGCGGCGCRGGGGGKRRHNTPHHGTRQVLRRGGLLREYFALYGAIERCRPIVIPHRHPHTTGGAFHADLITLPTTTITTTTVTERFQFFSFFGAVKRTALRVDEP